MAVVNVSDANLNEVIRSNRVVLVDFWAPWCEPCRMIAPVLEELSREMGDQLVVAKLNVDNNPVMARKYQVMSIPTMKLFVDGQEKQSMIGVQPKRHIEQLIRNYA